MTALWPDLGAENPHQLDAICARLTTDLQLNLETGEWEPIPRSTTRQLLRILCSGPHDRLGAPMLAELWHTDHGPFFISKLPGAVNDPPNLRNDPFAPPTAVLPTTLKDKRRHTAGGPAPGDGWRPVPVTLVRLLLNDPATLEADLWVKCAVHGSGTVDRVRLYRAYLQDQQRRRTRSADTPEPTVIELHDVATLFSR